MENKEEKYYVRSNGERVSIKTMETTHISNAIAKKYREMFESTNEDDFSNKLNELNSLKEEMHFRINKYHDESLKK